MDGTAQSIVAFINTIGISGAPVEGHGKPAMFIEFMKPRRRLSI